MNSFAIIFGHCVWIPPSPKAALVALNLFFGIGISTSPTLPPLRQSSRPNISPPARPRSRHRKKLLRSTPASEATRYLLKAEAIQRMRS